MKINEVVEYYGNKTKAAAALGVSEQCIRNWVKNDDVPYLTQLAIQVLSKGKLKADNKD